MFPRDIFRNLMKKIITLFLNLFFLGDNYIIHEIIENYMQTPKWEVAVGNSHNILHYEN